LVIFIFKKPRDRPINGHAADFIWEFTKPLTKESRTQAIHLYENGASVAVQQQTAKINFDQPLDRHPRPCPVLFDGTAARRSKAMIRQGFRLPDRTLGAVRE